jgi:hypothetical protein
VLFGCKHQHRETERSGDEHLDEHALGAIDVRAKHRAKLKERTKKKKSTQLNVKPIKEKEVVNFEIVSE